MAGMATRLPVRFVNAHWSASFQGEGEIFFLGPVSGGRDIEDRPSRVGAYRWAEVGRPIYGFLPRNRAIVAAGQSRAGFLRPEGGWFGYLHDLPDVFSCLGKP